MRRTRFLWKLYAGYLAVILSTAALISLLVLREAEADAVAALDAELGRHATFLAGYVAEAPPGPALQERVLALGNAMGVRLTVIAPDGAPVADSEEDPARMDNHSGRPEVIRARRDGTGSQRRYSATRRQEMVYVARRAQGLAEGSVVRAALPSAIVDARLSQLRATLLAGSAAAATLAAFLGYLFARRIAKPVASMTRVASALAAGGEDQRVVLDRRDELGDLGRAFNSMADTLRQRMEIISEDRNKLRAILRSMVEGLIAVDRDERVVHLNEAAASLLGVAERDPAGRPLTELTRVHRVTELLAAAMREDRVLDGEIRVRPAIFDQIVEMRASPLKDGSDQVVGAVGVLHDITELRKLELVRRDFVTNVSHELKTPVTAIRGLVETLLDDPEAERETQQRFLSKIQHQTDRLATLVQDLLTLSRLESGETASDQGPVDVRGSILESVQSLHAAAEKKSLTVRHDLPPAPVIVHGDHEALRQIVDNLLSNAINYTPAGGEVSVSVRAEGPEALLAVKDTGVGIEPRHLERIFERFYRVDKARSRAVGGTGLGLSIVKHRVQALRGRIDVTSAPGAGSTFTVRLPRVDESSSSDASGD